MSWGERSCKHFGECKGKPTPLTCNKQCGEYGLIQDDPEELMGELYPQKEYWELSVYQQGQVDGMALQRVKDKVTDIMDEGKERRKYGKGG